MTPTRWIVLAVLLSALLCLQFRGLERQPEKQVENVYTRLPDLPPSDVIPTYVASLFFGSFRALVIDILWVQLKKVQDERRWVELRENFRLISYFQPRNEAVWVHLGHHSSYNIANSFKDPERSWEWIRFGLDWLKKGVDKLPDSAYLKEQIGSTLHHKPTWREGRFDVDLLERIEKDTRLQELLQDRSPVERPMSAFELAILWYEKARDGLLDSHDVTQMGLILRADIMDIYIRNIMYLQGVYEWRVKKRPEEAKQWFLKAAEHADAIVERYKEILAPYHRTYADFYRAMPRIVDLASKARSGNPDDQRAYFEALYRLVLRDDGELSPDDGFLWHPRLPDAPLNRLKRHYALGQDPQECNDTFPMATLVQPNSRLPVTANLQPEGFDVDYYILNVPPPQGQACSGHDHSDTPHEHPPRNYELTLNFFRPPGAGLDLKATLYDSYRKPRTEIPFRDKTGLFDKVTQPGFYYFKVEPAAPTSPWPEDTRYAFTYRLDIKE